MDTDPVTVGMERAVDGCRLVPEHGAPRQSVPARRRAALACCVAVSVLAIASAARGGPPGFVGETKCAMPTCHGGALPASPADDPAWRPWKSARTQWLNSNIDRHSRAYRTLTGDASRRIGAYMAIDPTTSDRCRECHAPRVADLAPGSRYKETEGVTCEHCHGPAELWLDEHKAKDWPQKRAAFAAKGFYDNSDFIKRADKCASCHVAIDHEILAAGHPPLQFEMVAYADIMKHWDDSKEHPGFSSDPTLWALGQVVGLQHTATAIADRAAGADEQSLGRFHGFTEGNCYQCHHKLVEDVARQGQGHADMVGIVFATLFPDAQPALTSKWNALRTAVGRSAGDAHQQATELRTWLEPFRTRVVQARPDKIATKKLLERILDSGQTLGTYRVFSHAREAPPANTERVVNVDLPWWYTTGSREQTALAVQALCTPAFDQQRCAATFPELKALVQSINRTDQDPKAFNAALAGIKHKLY